MKIAKYFGIIVASLTLVIAAILFIQFNDSEKWSSNAHQSTVANQIININSDDTPQEQQHILNAFQNIADKYQLGVIRIDDQVGQSASYTIGVYDPNNQVQFTNLSGHLEHSGIRTMTSTKVWSTQQLDRKHQRLFNLLNGSTVQITALQAMRNHTQTVNGQYQLFGSNTANYTNVLTDFSQASGVSLKNLTTQHAFKRHSISMYFNLIILLSVLMGLLTIVSGLFTVYRNGKLIGIQKLLGYSNLAIIKSDAQNSLLAIILSLFVEISLINFFFKNINTSVYPILIGSQIPLILTIVMSFLIQYTLINKQRLSDFIKGHLKAKFMLVVVGLIFVIATACSAYTLKVIDYQATQLYLNAKKMANWSQRQNFQVLSELSTGNDAASFTYQSSKLGHDFKSFYSKIADTPGVYWANSMWFENNHQQQAALYQYWHLPNINTFSLLQFSPSALEKYNLTDSNNKPITIENSDHNRYYLLPEKFKSQPTYTSFFNKYPVLASSIEPTDSKSVTQFLAAHPVKILYYHEPKFFNSWSTADNRQLTSPVIEVITSENMTAIDSSNLNVIGVDNPLRLTNKVTKSTSFKEALKSSNLEDNHLVFSSIKDTLSANQSLFYKALFAGALFLVILLVVIWYTIIVLNEIWQAVHHKTLIVKRFLGYKKWHKYRGFYLLIGSVNLPIIILGSVLKSNFMILGFIIISLLELIIMNHSINKIERRKINDTMKE